MKELSSSYGRVFIGSREECFQTAAFLAGAQRGRVAAGKSYSWALTGGETPKDWYRWCVQRDALSPTLRSGTHWFTSDERTVPLSSPDSNFGNADRGLLSPLGIASANKHPWPVELPPPEAAASFEKRAATILGAGRGFDLCFLGLGDNTHTASFFPGSPLLRQPTDNLFAAVDTPQGWRLTITPAGLKVCGLIVVIVRGAGKAEALHRVLSGPYDPVNVPGQVLRSCAGNVVWLTDTEAASKYLGG
ncbi:MAG TPA: 6-phosphogluconolactonase [Candidatus Didemnitutus sp.]|nr:6-phosphogluconolactonase [Candidatus Didemnitutus sp.]